MQFECHNCDVLTSHLKRCNFNVIIMIYWPEGKCLWAIDAPGEPCWWYWLEILSAVICRAFCDIAEIQQYFQPPSRIFIMPEMLQMKYHSVDDITVFNSVQSWGDVYKTQVSFNIHFIVYNLALIAELRVVEFSSPWEMLITELSIWFQLHSVEPRYVWSFIHTQGTATIKNRRSWIIVTIYICLGGIMVYSREFSISSCLRTWNRRKLF